MNDMMVIEIGRRTLLLVMMLSAPMLVIALLVGLAISIFQAATQINEMTLTFIPKLISMGLALLLFMPWMLQLFKDFFTGLLVAIPDLLR